MIKTYKTILSVLLVVLIGLGVVLVTGVVDINKMVTEHENQNNQNTAVTYRDMFTSLSDNNLPLLKTDIDGVLYAMDTEGNVKFYEAGNNTLTEIAETGSYEVKTECSGQTLTAQIHYLEKDGKTTGYGLFTNELYEGVYVYDYAFFKVSDFFENYSHSSGTLLLMLDVDKTRFYSEDKVYSEIFRLYKDHTTEYFLNENQRVVDLDAKMRTDYKMFTDDIDDQTSSRLLFFSSRFYTAYDEYTKYDIMSSGGSGENIDNIRYIKDVAALNFWRTDSEVYYIRANEDDDSGFSLMKYDASSDTEMTAHWFQGNLADDYLIDGNYILNRKTGEIYDVMNDSSKMIDYSEMKKDFKPDLFEISDDGNTVVVRGANMRNKPAIIVCDFENGTQQDFTDDAFGFLTTIVCLDDGTVIMSLSTDTQGTSYYQLISKAPAAAAEETTAVEGDSISDESEA